jgi:putative ABC transport system substrate-binding protein
MSRRVISPALALTVAITVAPVATNAQAPADVPRIGYLVLSPLTDLPSPERAGFLLGLREHGYEDGKNISIEYRSADGDPEILSFLAEELVDLRVKAIVALGSPVVRAARQASQTVPIVMLFAADPVRLGLVQSLARPGTNITGMTHITTELGPKRLQLLKTALPDVKHVALVMDESNPGTEVESAAILATGRQMGIRVSIVGLPESTSDDALRARLIAARPDAIMTIIDPRVSAYRQFLPQFALERRIPTMFDWRPFVEAGGLMSYVPDFPDMARRAAAFVDKILKGADPADLPIQQPTDIQLTLNRKTASAVGVKFPEAMLLRADRVIE